MTKKESFIKAIGEGLSHPLNTFDIDCRGGNIRLSRLQGSDSAAQQWTMQRMAVGSDDYTGAFAVALPTGKLSRLRCYDLGSDA